MAYDPNIDYHAQAVQAAAAGNWDGVNSALASRQEKIDAQGGNDRGVSNDAILATLRQEYGQAPAAQTAQSAQTQKLDHANTDALRSYLDQWLGTAQRQSDAQIDRATTQNINDLARAQEDAQEQFQTQRNQIDIDEARAKDNQALYAQARGDRGGIGAAQYDSVMNTAAQNRQTVRNAQTKLATDTQRQIADLRAQGEFEKASAVLQLTQQYLSQLMSLEQWAAEYNLGVDQFNAQMDQWLASYQLQLRQLDMEQSQWQQQFDYNRSVDQRNYAYQLSRDAISDARYTDETAYNRSVDQRNYDYQLSRDAVNDRQTERQIANSEQQQAWENAFAERSYQDTQAENRRQQLASAAQSALNAGIMPSESMLAALGVDETYAAAYVSAVKAGLNSASGSNTSASSSPTLSASQTLQALERGVINDSTLDAYEAHYGESYFKSHPEALSEEAQRIIRSIRYDQARQKRQTGSSVTAFTRGWQQVLGSAVEQERISSAEGAYILDLFGWGR